jgi:hypothetical protein
LLAPAEAAGKLIHAGGAAKASHSRASPPDSFRISNQTQGATMEQFLRACRALGIDVVGTRAARVRQAIARQLAETYMFFTCGYDFIFAPSDKKFRGIVSVFIEPQGALHINISDEYAERLKKQVYDPDVNVSVEGTSFYQKKVFQKVTTHVQAGQGVSLNKDLMRQHGQLPGMRAGGVGNYNLQTKALEACMQDNSGALNAYGKFFAKDDELKKEKKGKQISTPSTQIQFVQAFKGPLDGLTPFKRALNDQSLQEIREALLPYWERDGVAALGVG